LQEPVRQLPDAVRLPLLEQALPALRQMSAAQYQVFRDQVAALIHADNHVSLFEYALQCVLNRALDADYNRRRPSVRFTSAAQVAPQVATVLSLLAWEGQAEASAAQAAFTAGMQTYNGSQASANQLVPRAESLPRAFHAALQTLAMAAPPIKRQLIAACAATIQADQQVTVREGELLRAICATLDCPMPPLVEEAASA
jgi:hypothetical protein